MARIHVRSEPRRRRLLPTAIATPAAAAAGVAAGYVFFRRRPDDTRGGAEGDGSYTASGPVGKRVEEAMSRDPRSVSPGEPVAEAARIMRSEDVGSLPVVDQERLVGIITDRDIAIRVVSESRDPQVTTVGEISSSNPVTVRPEQDLAEALQLMAQHQVRRLPVVEDERLIGIVAQADVALEGEDRRTGEVVEQVSQPG
jgi:CBS domain-containing protein